MRVRISLADARFTVDRRGVGQKVRKVLKEKAPRGAVDLIFCRDKEMIAMNEEFKGHKCSTDVLAFELVGREDPGYLGEVYVNLQMARRQSRDLNVPYMEEVDRLAIHGVLHLLGFKDDTAKDRARMWALQEGYVAHG
jgi:rRNA maturation RNase YbeY